VQVDAVAYPENGRLHGRRSEAALGCRTLLRAVHCREHAPQRSSDLLPVEIVAGNQAVRRIDDDRAAQLAADRLERKCLEVLGRLGRRVAVFGTRLELREQLRGLRCVDDQGREVGGSLQRRGIGHDPHALHVRLTGIEARWTV
jgi:hypothetical protein